MAATNERTTSGCSVVSLLWATMASESAFTPKSDTRMICMSLPRPDSLPAFGNRVEKRVDENGDSTVDWTERYAYDSWNPAKPSPIGNENWDVIHDLDEVAVHGGSAASADNSYHSALWRSRHENSVLNVGGCSGNSTPRPHS